MAQVRAFLALLAAALVVSVVVASPAATRDLVLRHVGRFHPRCRIPSQSRGYPAAAR